MTLELKAKESVARGTRRIVRKQLRQALKALAAPSGQLSDEAVHEVRKRLKVVRALLQLVRSGLPSKSYDRQMACFRDASRPMREVRDAHVLLQTLDRLVTEFTFQLTQQTLAPIREALLAHQKEVRTSVFADGTRIAMMASRLADARKRVREWNIDTQGWSTLRKGLKRIYKRGRRSFAATQADPTIENFHGWRKLAKQLWHQLQVLSRMEPEALQEMINQIRDLGDRLGDDRDLAMLRQTLSATPRNFGGRTLVRKLLPLIDRRRSEHQRTALRLGQQIYEKKPRAFVKDLEIYWRAWR